MYGILIAATSIVCLLLIERIIKKNKIVSVNDFWNLSLILIPLAIIGGRIYHVLDYWKYYFKFPLEILNIKNGGLGIFGAIIFSTVLVYVFAKIKKQNPFIYLDLFVLFAPLVQIAGRIGNYLNTELFGLPTDKLWGISIPAEFRPTEFLDSSKFHPLFVYESILLFILFSFLTDMYLNKKILLGKGKILGVYLIGYGLIRATLEPLRIGNALIVGGLNLTYLFAGLMIVVGLVLVTKNFKIKNNEFR